MISGIVTSNLLSSFGAMAAVALAVALALLISHGQLPSPSLLVGGIAGCLLPVVDGAEAEMARGSWPT